MFALAEEGGQKFKVTLVKSLLRHWYVWDFLSNFRKKIRLKTQLKPEMLPNCYIFLDNYFVTITGHQQLYFFYYKCKFSEEDDDELVSSDYLNGIMLTVFMLVFDNFILFFFNFFSFF